MGYEKYYVSSSEKKAAFRVIYSIDSSANPDDPGIDRLIGDAHIAARTKKDIVIANQLDTYHLVGSECASMRHYDEVMMEEDRALASIGGSQSIQNTREIDRQNKTEQACETAIKATVEIHGKLMGELE